MPANRLMCMLTPWLSFRALSIRSPETAEVWHADWRPAQAVLNLYVKVDGTLVHVRV